MHHSGRSATDEGAVLSCTEMPASGGPNRPPPVLTSPLPNPKAARKQENALMSPQQGGGDHCSEASSSRAVNPSNKGLRPLARAFVDEYYSDITAEAPERLSRYYTVRRAHDVAKTLEELPNCMHGCSPRF